MEFWRSISAILAVGGGGGAVAYGLFVWLGKRQLDSWFEKGLEDYKHQQQKELEEFRHRINALFSRVTKIHEKEFEILPVAWQKSLEALGHAFPPLSGFQQGPDLDRMSEAQRRKVLETSGLEQFQIEEILAASDMATKFMEVRNWHRLGRAKEAADAFHNYLWVNRVFMSRDLHEKFRELDNLLQKALQEEMLNRECGVFDSERKATKALFSQAESVSEEIGRMIQSRFRFEEAL